MKIKLLKNLLLFFISLFSILYFPHISTNSILGKVYATTILFEDNFDQGDLGKWQPISGTWVFQNNKYGTRIETPFTLAETQAGDFSWTDYDFEVELTVIAGEDRNLFFRSNLERSIYGGGTWNWPTGYGLHITSGIINLVKFLPTSSLYVSSGSFSFPTGETHRLKMSSFGRRIRIYADDVLKIDYTDLSENPYLSGRIALAASTGTIYPTEVWYDNVVVSCIEGNHAHPQLPLPPRLLLQPLLPHQHQHQHQFHLRPLNRLWLSFPV